MAIQTASGEKRRRVEVGKRQGKETEKRQRRDREETEKRQRRDREKTEKRQRTDRGREETERRVSTYIISSNSAVVEHGELLWALAV